MQRQGITLYIANGNIWAAFFNESLGVFVDESVISLAFDINFFAFLRRTW